MTITVNNNVEGNPGGAGPSATATISVSTGHTIVALVQYNDFGGGGSITGVTDSSGANTYTLRKTVADGLGRTFLVFDCIGIANAVTSVSANASNSAGFPSVVAFDLSSGNTIAYSDSNGTAYVNNNPSTTNGVTTGTLSIGTASTGALVGICSDFGNGANISIGTGFTAGSTLFGNPYAEYKTTTASAAITYTDSVANGQVLVIGGLYVEAAAAPTVIGAWQRIRPMYPPGALPGKLGRFYQSPKSYAVAANVTAALTGQGATFASGTAIPGTAVATTGQAATFSAGTVIPATSIAVTGQAATFAAGPVTPSNSISLTGQAATFATGLLTPSTSRALTGQAGTFAAGTLSPSTTVLLTGQVATFGGGTMSTGSDVTVSLTGQAATFTAGILAPNTTLALSGGAASFAAGNLLAASTLALTGQGTSSTAGALARSTAVSLTGLAASFTGGIVTPVSPNVTVGLTGQSSTFTSGTLGISSSLALLGTVGTFATGAVTAVSGNVVALTGSRMTASAGIVGLAQFLVPNVQGVPLGTAALLLNNATLQVGTLTYQNSTLVALGSVISQAPPATTLVLEDSQVALLISSGFVNPTNNPLGEIKLPNLPNKILPPDNALVDDRGVIATNWWRFLLNVANQALGTNQTVPATVTIGASPYVFTTPAQGSLLISGGPVTLIEYSKDAAAWYPTGVTQGLIPMVPNDHVRITYMNAPTLTFFPR